MVQRQSYIEVTSCASDPQSCIAHFLCSVQMCRCSMTDGNHGDRYEMLSIRRIYVGYDFVFLISSLLVLMVLCVQTCLKPTSYIQVGYGILSIQQRLYFYVVC